MGSNKRPLSRRQKLQKNVSTIWQYSRQVFAVSSVNGVSHIALAKTGGRRILWTGLFTIGILGWFYQTTTLLEYYYRYPSVVKIQVEKPPIMDFPALTICNVNRIRKSVFCKEYPNKCTEEHIVLSEEEIFNVTFEYMKRGQKYELGHQLEDIIVSCEFSGTPKLDTEECIKYFVPMYDPHMGNCFIFLSGVEDRPRLFVSEPNAWQDKKDMDLVLNVEHDEYLDDESVTPGLIVTLHEDGTYPHILAHGIHVYAEHTYSLAVEKVSVNLLSEPFKTNCTDYKELPFHSALEMDFSPRICTIQCLLHHQKRECPHSYVTDNVVLYAEQMPYNADEITEEDKQCAKRLSESYREYCSTVCGVPCHDTHFPVVIDSSPTSSHKIVVKESSLEAYKKRQGNDKVVFASDVRIHYQTMQHSIFNHTPEFTTELLFSYLGGISGGWLGISLLEFCAFLEGLLSVLVFSFGFCSRSPPKNRKSKKTRSSRWSAPRTPPNVKVVPNNVCQGKCRCGGVLLGVPVATRSGKTVQVVPFAYY